MGGPGQKRSDGWPEGWKSAELESLEGGCKAREKKKMVGRVVIGGQ